MPRTKSLAERIKDYSGTLGPMNDDDLLDEVHRARTAHKAAPAGEKDEAFLKSQAATAEMTARFGIGAAERKFRERRAKIEQAGIAGKP